MNKSDKLFNTFLSSVGDGLHEDDERLFVAYAVWSIRKKNIWFNDLHYKRLQQKIGYDAALHYDSAYRFVVMTLEYTRQI